MGRTFSERLRSLVGGPDRDADPPSNPPDRDTSLRTCPECEKTFIVEEMDHCPDCGTAVEETPTERDLGLL